MAWQEMFSITPAEDADSNLLTGRTDDWVIPFRLCTDRDGNIDTTFHDELNFLTSNGTSVSYNNKIYIFHGFIASVGTTSLDTGGYTNRALVYDPSSAAGAFGLPLSDYRLQHIRPIPYVAYDSSACVHLSEIHIFGGQSRVGGTLFSHHYKYNPSTDTYTALASMPSARQGHSSISVGNYIYVLGGGATSTWRYDVGSNTWSTMTNMPRARDSFGVIEYNNKIYVIGGSVGGIYEPLIDVYDIDLNTWSTLNSSKNIPTPRRHLTVERMGREVICSGGLTDSSTDSNLVQSFRLDTEVWSNLTALPSEVSRQLSGIYNGFLYSLFGWFSLSSTLGGWLTKINRLQILELSPNTPTGLSQFNGNVQWNIETDAIYYEIQYGTTSSGTLTTLSNIKGDSYTLSGLTLGVEYRLRIRAINSTYSSAYTSYIYFTIANRPNNWVWSYNIASGSNVYFVSGKAIFIMTAIEWNNFTSRINEFRAYKSLSSASFTTVSTNMDVTKEIINEALNAIRAMSAYFTGGNVLISNRVAGQNILEANIYINIRDCLNSIT